MMRYSKKWIKVMQIGEKMGCHQMPERSFFYKGYQFPVCARCTGVIISSIIALMLFYKKRLPIKYCIAMSSVMLCDWLVQYFEIQESNNPRRFVTGVIGGFGFSTLQYHAYYMIFRLLFTNSTQKTH